MKKQIFLLTFLSLAFLFAGVNQAFGQVKPYQTVPTTLPSCIPPEALTDCTADALHPVQGETYPYTVATTDPTDIVRWFVVNNTAMVAAGDSLVSSIDGILAEGNAAIDDGTGGDPYIYDVISGTYENGGAAGNTTIELQWKYFDGVTNEILLVAYVEAADGCSNNIGVFRIIPTPAFTIDVASIMEDGTNPAGPNDTPNEECVSRIESAIYNSTLGTIPGGETPGDSLIVDYGENWVFFVVNGANYFDSWMPEFQISYTGGTAPVAEMSWAYLADATTSDASVWNTLTGDGPLAGTATTWTGNVVVVPGATAATAGTSGFSAEEGLIPAAGGECIIVRVRLDWGTEIEHDQANGTLTFAANGIAFDGDDSNGGTFYDDRANFEDLMNTAGGIGTACQPDSFDNDVVDYIITPRPQADEGTPEQEDKSGQGTN